MADIEELTHNTYVPLISYGRGMFDYLPGTVIDKTSLRLVQVGDLHRTIDSTETRVGSATLLRSLMQPLISLDHILAKQNSLRELESNDRLRNAIIEYLGQFSEGEEDLFLFLREEINQDSPYAVFKRAVKTGANIGKAVENIPEPESEYLSILVNDAKSFGNSETWRLMRGPINRTFRGIKSKEETRWFEPRLRFRPSRFTWGTLATISPIVATLPNAEKIGEYLKTLPSEASILRLVTFATFPLAVAGIMYSGMLKPQMDTLGVIEPLKRKSLLSPEFARAIDAVGSLDEMVSFAKFDGVMPHDTAIPKVTNEDKHYFEAENLRNPVQARDSLSYVPNDVNLNGSRLTFITGPNSGGKTTYCKSIAQNQLLAQIGSRVVASKARINLADKIAYQAPHFDSLQDEEGRFGTELKRTRDVFYSTTPKSLVVLDELSEGTTAEEKMRVSQNVLDGFHTIGNNTVLVTHNHELVDGYRNVGRGQFLQAEFNGDAPTYRLVEGISKVSHADKIAQKIGFSKEDIQRHLEERGYN